MKVIKLFSEISFGSKNEDESLKVLSPGELNLNLTYNNQIEKRIIQNVAIKNNLPEQTIKILFNLYFNELYLILKSAPKNTVMMGSYFKFIKLNKQK